MRLVSEITASRESVENVGKHRKERCPDTLLRQVGFAVPGQNGIFTKWSWMHIAFAYHKHLERLPDADSRYMYFALEIWD